MAAPRITAAARVQRLLAMLQWAAGHPDGVTVDELCERFRLRPDDLVRELDLASMIGADAANYDDMPFEVFIEDGMVYVRLFGFRRPMRLTPAEGFALVAAADALVAKSSDTEADEPLRRALDKLAALLGIEPGEAVDVDVDPDGGTDGRALRDAIRRDRQVAFTYWTYGRDAVGHRTVDPWDLFTEAGTWYLVGWAHDAAAPRHFRLDRVEELEVLDERRSRSKPADLPGTLGVADDAPTVVVDLGPRGRWVAEVHPVLEAEPTADDRLRVTMAVTAAPWLERLLLQLGPEAEVVRIDDELGGPDLARATARRVLERYEAADSAPTAPR